MQFINCEQNILSTQARDQLLKNTTFKPLKHCQLQKPEMHLKGPEDEKRTISTMANFQLTGKADFKEKPEYRFSQKQSLEPINMTESNIVIKSQEKAQKEECNESKNKIDFDYFFQTLKNYPEEAQMPTYEYEWSEEQQKPMVWNRKKKIKKQDKPWRFYRKQQEQEKQKLRKSRRIEQMQQKERLERQMAELRFYYYNGRYRYDHVSCRMKLSFLGANHLTPQEYAAKKDAEIPKLPTQLNEKQKVRQEKIIQSKRQSLTKRIITDL